jgi:hypothetical protein
VEVQEDQVVVQLAQELLTQEVEEEVVKVLQIVVLVEKELLY